MLRTLPRLLAFLVYASAYTAAAGPSRHAPLAAPLADPAQAALVFVVDAPYAIRAVTLADERGKEVASLQIGSVAGEYAARTFALAPGRYRIATLVVPDFRRKPFEVTEAPLFELKPGRLNYVGDLELYLERDDLMCRLNNRSGRLIVHLREAAPAIAASAPLAFVGGDDDGWVATLGEASR